MDCGNACLEAIRTFWTKACGWTPTCTGLSALCHQDLMRQADPLKNETSRFGRQRVSMVHRFPIIPRAIAGIFQRLLRALDPG